MSDRIDRLLIALGRPGLRTLLSVGALLIALVTLIGWATGVDALLYAGEPLAVMQPLTAVMVAGLAAGVLCLGTNVQPLTSYSGGRGLRAGAGQRRTVGLGIRKSEPVHGLFPRPSLVGTLRCVTSFSEILA